MSSSSFWRIGDSGLESLQEPYGRNYAVRIAIYSLALLKQGQPRIRYAGQKSCRRGRPEATG